MKEDVFLDLASLLNPQISSISQQGSPLLVTMGIIAKTLNLSLHHCNNNDDIEAIAHSSGFRFRRVTLTPNWWEKDAGVLLAFTQEDNIPVALLPSKNSRYELFNPLKLNKVTFTRSLNQNLQSTAYAFYRPFPEGEIDMLSLLKFALQRYTGDLKRLITIGLIVTLLGMLIPQATGILIDNAIPNANQRLLLEMGIGLIFVTLGMTSFQLIQSLVILKLQSQGSYESQAALWDRLLKLKPTFFRQYSTGDLYNRVSAIIQIQNRLSGTILQNFFTSFLALLNIFLLLFYSFALGMVAMGIGFLLAGLTLFLGVKIKEKNRKIQQYSGEIFGFVVQLIGGISKLRIAAAEERAFTSWAKPYRQQVQLLRDNQLFEDWLILINLTLPILSSTIIFALTVNLLEFGGQEGELSLGTFLAFNTAYGVFIISVTRLSNTLVQVIDITTWWERAQPILSASPEVSKKGANSITLSGKLKLDNISFRYYPDSPLVLKNITLEAEAGEFIAIVGPSGSGKSTLVRLLLGFETPETGQILYDDRELSELDITQIRRQLGVVLQNGQIMTGSIWDNIAGGTVVPLEQAWKALEMAGLATDIEKMPMGIHTIISEGGNNLSGGQLQRLLIARALVHSPKILIFDEATSALDNRTQATVTQSLESLGVTRIAIAHRLSTIGHADRIYVMQDGQVVQQGNFTELTQIKGLFADLMSRQYTESHS